MLKGLVTMRTAVELLKGIAKCVILWGLSSTGRAGSAWPHGAGRPAGRHVAVKGLCRGLMTRLRGSSGVGALDCSSAVQYSRSLRMTKQQVKDNTASRREILSSRRACGRYARWRGGGGAGCRNCRRRDYHPTHLAVVLRYDPKSTPRPLWLGDGCSWRRRSAPLPGGTTPIVRNCPGAGPHRMVSGHATPGRCSARWRGAGVYLSHLRKEVLDGDSGGEMGAAGWGRRPMVVGCAIATWQAVMSRWSGDDDHPPPMVLDLR